MKKTLFRWLFMLMCICATSLTFSSCSKDGGGSDPIIEEPQTPSSPILGTWEEEGSTDKSFVRFSFYETGKGVLVDEDGSRNFTYTFAETSNGVGDLKMWLSGSSTVQNFRVTITGRTMMLTQGSSTFVLHKM